MVLEELHELIETLQKRIAEHGSALQQSEALTRYALIDPLLRGLGWDTGDPSQVLVEYRSSAGSADYALLGTSSKPQIIIEAKKLGTPLSSAVTQVINYCIQDGYEYFAVTDGRLWELYETNRPGPLAQRVVVKLDLQEPAAQVARSALALWRPAALEGALQPAPETVVSSQKDDLELGGDDESSVDEPLGPEWHRLHDFTPEVGTQPTAIRFEDGREKGVKGWTDASEALVLWLKQNGHLTDSDLPIRLGSASIYFINRNNDRGNGQPFHGHRLVDGWYVNSKYSAKQQVSNAQRVIRFVGLNPADFAVKFQ